MKISIQSPQPIENLEEYCSNKTKRANDCLGKIDIDAGFLAISLIYPILFDLSNPNNLSIKKQ